MEYFKRLYSWLEGVWWFTQLKNKKEISLGSILEKQTRKNSDKPLILFEDRVITYGQFNEAVNRYSHFFQKRGFIKGDTVAVLMENRPECLIIHAGLAKIGVIPALVNNNITGQTLVHAINIADASALIIGVEYLKEFVKIRKELKLKKSGCFFIETDNSKIDIPSGVENLETLLAMEPISNPLVFPPINSKDTLEYIYTSGTTGLPKATELKHQKWLQLGFGSGGVALKSISSDINYICLPLYHNSGINIAWSTTLVHGGTAVLKRKFSVGVFWDDIRKYKATIFVYIGELCRYLNNQPPKEDDDDNTLKYILGNGLRGDYWVEFQKRFDIKRIIEVYGATEGVGAIGNFKGVPGMIGKLTVAGIRMGEVVRYNIEEEEILKDQNGLAVKCEIGETGLFLAAINNTNPFSGYKNNEKATNSKIVTDVFKKGDKYFISGDLFKMHKNGYVSFVDRLGDTFKWKGEVVATNEVSDILSRFGAFEDCNVYGVTVNKTEGRAGMAALTMLPGVKFDPNSFAVFVKNNFAVFARPYFVRIRKEKDATTSFKQIKLALQKEGFNPAVVKDPLYFFEPKSLKYIKLTKNVFDDIENGVYKF